MSQNLGPYHREMLEVALKTIGGLRALVAMGGAGGDLSEIKKLLVSFDQQRDQAWRRFSSGRAGGAVPLGEVERVDRLARAAVPERSGTLPAQRVSIGR